uniref:Uncharacterized protein n=1 Tax=Rhizophora mucronata TaxID=61149 RepID=A0A2P2NFZ3_RHIMU
MVCEHEGSLFFCQLQEKAGISIRRTSFSNHVVLSSELQRLVCYKGTQITINIRPPITINCKDYVVPNILQLTSPPKVALSCTVKEL